jgi:hypothetical protein
VFWFCQFERVLGDYLLSRWDGKTNLDVRLRESVLLLPNDFINRLGAVTVKLNLATPVADKPGAPVCFLIPDKLPKGSWTNASEVSALSVLSDPTMISDSAYGVAKGRTLMPRTVLPGKYRLKVLWQPRPAGGTMRTNIYLAQPGYYESVESQPVTVVKGQVATVTMTCTNRVGGGEAYVEDEEWLRKASGE